MLYIVLQFFHWNIELMLKLSKLQYCSLEMWFFFSYPIKLQPYTYTWNLISRKFLNFLFLFAPYTNAELTSPTPNIQNINDLLFSLAIVCLYTSKLYTEVFYVVYFSEFNYLIFLNQLISLDTLKIDVYLRFT